MTHLTMYVTATGTTLPVAIEAVSGSRSSRMSWSAWGAHLHIVAPTDAVPIKTITG